MMNGTIKRIRFLAGIAAATFALASALPLCSQVTEAVDPFYESLLEESRFFYQEGKIAEAIENLEIAYFGFLDSPRKLAECYIYLAVCHFQQKSLEKARHYQSEIKRLKLDQQTAALKLPEVLAKKYAEVAAKLDKS